MKSGPSEPAVWLRDQWQVVERRWICCNGICSRSANAKCRPLLLHNKLAEIRYDHWETFYSTTGCCFSGNKQRVFTSVLIEANRWRMLPTDHGQKTNTQTVNWPISCNKPVCP